MRKNYANADNRIRIIRSAFERNGIKGDLAISRETGLQYDRLHRSRMTDINSMTLGEFFCLQRHADFTDEEILQIAKEGGDGCLKTNRILPISYAKH